MLGIQGELAIHVHTGSLSNILICVTWVTLSPKYITHSIQTVVYSDKHNNGDSVTYTFNTYHIEGSWPEWCISSTIYSRDTPFWLGNHRYKIVFMLICITQVNSSPTHSAYIVHSAIYTDVYNVGDFAKWSTHSTYIIQIAVFIDLCNVGDFVTCTLYIHYNNGLLSWSV